MENVYSWLFILSGSTITVLGSFLIASGRELRSKRREFDRFKRNQTAKPVNPSVAGQRSEAHSPAELIAKNEELVKEISSLSNRLEESQRTLDEHESEQSRLLGVQSENQQLQEEIGRLSNQLETSERQLGESFRRIEETAAAGTAQQAEIAKLKRQLAERETAIETLQEAAQKAAAMQSENQRLQEQTAYTERRAIVERHAQLQTRFAELMQQTEELTAKNTQLLKEADALARTLAASEENAEELRASERSARLNNRQLIETNEQLRREIADFRQQLATAQSQLGESAMSKQEGAEWNRKLQSEIGELKQELEQRQATVNELQDAERRCSEFQSESQKLRLENQGLQKERPPNPIECEREPIAGIGPPKSGTRGSLRAA
jgi:chromosome segregation ATPase